MTQRPRTQHDADGRVGARNKARILRAATEVFSAKGFDGTRIADIAAAAGLPKANVYYYFSGKEAIYRAIIADLLRGWDAALDWLSADREPAEAIALYVEAKLDYSRRHSAESRLFANEVIRGGRFLARADMARMRASTRRKAAVIEAWIAAGKLRPVDPGHFFVLLWSATQFYAEFAPMACMALETHRLRKADFVAAAQTIAALVLHGCGVPAPRRGTGADGADANPVAS